LNRWNATFSVIECAYVSEVRQIEVHTAESSVNVPSHLEVEIDIAKLKKYKQPDSDEIPAESFEARSEVRL
jgi:hypothetical protein